MTLGLDRLLSSQIRLPGSGTQVEERTSQGKRWKTRASSVAECWKAAKFCFYQYLSQFQCFELLCAMLAGLRGNVATLANLQKRVRIASGESVKVRSKKVELQKWICVISKFSWGPLLATAAIKYTSCTGNGFTAEVTLVIALTTVATEVPWPYKNKALKLVHLNCCWPATATSLKLWLKPWRSPCCKPQVGVKVNLV